tara:strand:- start:4296 stop:4700 length:405 start_codon:yes stop_codon:yes gene_type:complete
MPLKNGRLILERQLSDFAERFTIDPNNLLSIGTAVRVTTSGSFDIEVCQSSSDDNYIGVIYALERTSFPYVAMMGRCIVNVRNSVSKGDNIQLDSSKGFFTSGGGGSLSCRGIALTSQSNEHGQVEAILFPGPR